MTSPKPIVFFTESTSAAVGGSATLWGVTGHPRLGDLASVWTSTVVDIRDDGNTIETRNTIYKKMEG